MSVGERTPPRDFTLYGSENDDPFEWLLQVRDLIRFGVNLILTDRKALGSSRNMSTFEMCTKIIVLSPTLTA